MSNLRVLDVKAPAKAKVVERVEVLLQMAKEGQIVDLSFAASKADGSTISGYTPTDDAQRRIASVSMLLFRLQKQAEEQAGAD